MGPKEENEKICGRKLCMSCQTGFGLIYKHGSVLHSHLAKLPVKRNLFTDNGYKLYIENYLLKRKMSEVSNI